MKIDDDCFFNLERIQAMINSPKKDAKVNVTGFMMGYGWSKRKPLRDTKLIGQNMGKWLMPTYMFPKEIYPDYMAGPGYVLNRVAVHRILEVKARIDF